MADMLHGEEKAKRWRITILDLLVFTASICIAVTLLHTGIVGFGPSEGSEFAPVQFTAGLFALAGSLGAFVGKAYTGTVAGGRQYCCATLLAIISFGFFWQLVFRFIE